MDQNANKAMTFFDEDDKSSEVEGCPMKKAIGNDPQLLRKRIDVINALGVTGERANIALISSTIDSRLLEPDATGQQTLALQLFGERGAGKSHTLETCLKVQHPSNYHSISTGSDKSFFYAKTSFKNKAIILGEAFKLEKNRDSEFAYHLRCLLSEGGITHQVSQRTGKGFNTVELCAEGPISFLTSTTVNRLELQLESRTMKIWPDESAKQTAQIVSRTAEIACAGSPEVDVNLIKSWQEFHQSLKPVKVVIPYIIGIAKEITAASSLPITTRRSFKRLLSLIKSIALLYQHQRSKDALNRIVSDIADYHMAVQMASEIFEEGINSHGELDEERLSFLQNAPQPIDIGTLAQQWGVSKSAVSKWILRAKKDGFVTWRDSNGRAFKSPAALKKAKHSGKAFVKATSKKSHSKAVLLPTALELTGDPEWGKGGRLWRLYDLRLNWCGI